MEKIKPFLRALKKHHFWIVCVVAVIVVLTGLYLAFEDFDQSFNKNMAAVQAQYKLLDEIERKDVGGSRLAGDSWPKEADKKSRVLRDELLAAARKLQGTQELEWPKKLGADFPAKAKEQGRLGKMPPDMVDKWQKNLPAEIDALKEMANAPLRAKEGVAREGGLQWNDEAFQQFRNQFVGKDAQGPALFDMQEKLWVAQSVMRCIAATNEGATDNYNLPISTIETFSVGPTVVNERPLRTVDVPGGAAPPPPPAAAAVPAGAAQPGAPAAAGAAPRVPPAPVAATVATAPAPKPITGLRAYPIRLRMRMNPSKLNRLLASLVNQKTLIIVDDVYFENELKLVVKGGPPAPPAPAPAPGPGAAGPGAPGFGAAPAAGVPAGGPGIPVAGRPGGPPAVGGPGAGPPVPAEPAVAAGGRPQLVQVPRGSVVEIFATAYFVEPKEVETIKIASNYGIPSGSNPAFVFGPAFPVALIDRGRL